MGGSFALGVVGPTDAGQTEESHCPWMSSAPIAHWTTADNERLTIDATPSAAHMGGSGTGDSAQIADGVFGKHSGVLDAPHPVVAILHQSRCAAMNDVAVSAI
jgi:hypothetical protein